MKNYYVKNKPKMVEKYTKKNNLITEKLTQETLENFSEERKLFPFLTDKSFSNMANVTLARGNGLDPIRYLKRHWYTSGQATKIPFANWLRQFKGFGGDKIVKSIGPIAKAAGPGLIAYQLLKGQPAEAAETAVGSFLPPGVDFGEELGPPQGSLDYYIEHPWNRPKGVLDFNNQR